MLVIDGEKMMGGRNDRILPCWRTAGSGCSVEDEVSVCMPSVVEVPLLQLLHTTNEACIPKGALGPSLPFFPFHVYCSASLRSSLDGHQ